MKLNLRFKVAGKTSGPECVWKLAEQYWRKYGEGNLLVRVKCSFDGFRWRDCTFIMYPERGNGINGYSYNWWKGERFVGLTEICFLPEVEKAIGEN